jgi:hypothetical protein
MGNFVFLLRRRVLSYDAFMERLLLLALFLLSIPAANASEEIARRLGSTYGTCAREGELAMIRIALPGVNAEELERTVYAFRNNVSPGFDCQCPTIGPTALVDLEAEMEEALNVMLATPDGFKPEEIRQIQAVILACEVRQQDLYGQSLKISRDVYNGPVPAGFTLIERFSDRTTGLDGYIVQNNLNPQEVTIAFAGTEEPNDVVADILHKGRNQHRAAVTAARLNQMAGYLAQGKKVTCTGHSLGGGLAQGFCASLLATMQARDSNFSKRQADDRLRVVTFGSLGGASMVSNEALIRNTWFASNNTHFVVNGDLVASFDPPVAGQIRSIGTSGDAVDAHDLGTFEELTRNGRQWISRKQPFTRISQLAINAFNSARQQFGELWRRLRNR